MGVTPSKQPQTGNSWTFLSPGEVDPEAFGLREIHAVMVKKHTDKTDVRSVYHEGWRTVAELTDYDPKTGVPLKEAAWFVFAATGTTERGWDL